MKVSKILFIILIIVIIIATIKSCSTEKKIIKNSEKEIIINHIDGKQNEKILILTSKKWERYYIENKDWEVMINRNGKQPLMLRWKTLSDSNWQEGSWYYQQESDISGITDLTIVEFKLFPGYPKKEIKVYQRKKY